MIAWFKNCLHLWRPHTLPDWLTASITMLLIFQLFAAAAHAASVVL